MRPHLRDIRVPGFATLLTYPEYRQTHAWLTKREAVLERDGDRCQGCGSEAAEVHHLTYEHIGDEPIEDLISLCASCHEAEHSIRSSYSPLWLGVELDLLAACAVSKESREAIFEEYPPEEWRCFDPREHLEDPSAAAATHLATFVRKREVIASLNRDSVEARMLRRIRRARQDQDG